MHGSSKLFEPLSQSLVGAINEEGKIECQSYGSFIRYNESLEI
jgi:hypothetical protein